MNPVPSIEDRIWAVLSHLSALAFGMGIVLPVIGWSDQRRKSNYASFQSLQALGYQSLGFTIWLLSYLVVVIVVATVLFALAFRSGDGESTDAALRLWIVVLLIPVLGLFAAYYVLPIVAAVACGLGRDFRYPILGDRLARYLGYDLAKESEGQRWLDAENESRWVAAMGHFSILVLIWGMLAPLSAWILQGKANRFLKIQSVQALMFQGAATILYFAAMFLYMVGVVLIVAGLGAIEHVSFSSPAAILGIVIFAASVLLSVLLFLFLPLLHILGQWAGYRVLKGDDYRYPLVGRWVTKWITKYPDIEEN